MARVDVIATDHAPHQADEKHVEFDRAPFGIVGLETGRRLTARSRSCTPASSRCARLVRAAGRRLPRGFSTSRAGRCVPAGAADITILAPDLSRRGEAGRVPLEVAQHAVRTAGRCAGRRRRDDRRGPDGVRDNEAGAWRGRAAVHGPLKPAEPPPRQCVLDRALPRLRYDRPSASPTPSTSSGATRIRADREVVGFCAARRWPSDASPACSSRSSGCWRRWGRRRRHSSGGSTRPGTPRPSRPWSTAGSGAATSWRCCGCCAG